MQNLQPYSHYCFSKISRTLFDFLNNTYWVSLFVRNNLLIFWTGVSCFSVTLLYSTLFCCGGKANLVWFTHGFLQVNPLWAGHPDGFLQVNTLLLYPSLSPYRQTDGETNTLASRGLEEPAHTSRGLEEPFFQLCCCVSFWFWREIGFGCTYYYVLGVPYSCGAVLVFLVLAGNSFWCYVRT